MILGILLIQGLESVFLTFVSVLSLILSLILDGMAHDIVQSVLNGTDTRTLDGLKCSKTLLQRKITGNMFLYHHLENKAKK